MDKNEYILGSLYCTPVYSMCWILSKIIGKMTRLGYGFIWSFISSSLTASRVRRSLLANIQGLDTFIGHKVFG
jgi:hypothetical protein